MPANFPNKGRLQPSFLASFPPCTFFRICFAVLDYGYGGMPHNGLQGQCYGPGGLLVAARRARSPTVTHELAASMFSHVIPSEKASVSPDLYMLPVVVFERFELTCVLMMSDFAAVRRN